MATTQSEDPNEKVDHPRHYNQSPSGIECIELIEHLPGNLSAAVKYIWRCGLKVSETPLRDLKSARWYTERELRRIRVFELGAEAVPKTDVVWRALARQVIDSDDNDSTLSEYLSGLLAEDFIDMLEAIDAAIYELEKAPAQAPSVAEAG